MATVLGPTWERTLASDSRWARGEVGFWMWRAGLLAEPLEGAAEPFALQIAGDWRGAADMWASIGCPYEVAMSLADGDADAMHEALSIFDGLGARPAASWLRARMRAAGVQRIARGPNQRTRANPAGLTGRQIEVLRLLVGGDSNGEIAASLFLSKKTVEHHVSAIFSKLGVPDRAKAIAAGRAILEAADA